jgi:uncharacterized protein DUF4440
VESLRSMNREQPANAIATLRISLFIATKELDDVVAAACGIDCSTVFPAQNRTADLGNTRQAAEQVKRAWPNGAVLGGMVEASETVAGKRNTFRGRFADIWAKRDGRWQVVFTQIEKVP